MKSFPAASVALVQGASRGIGLGLVKALLKEPCFDSVVATCRDPGSAGELQALTDGHLKIHALDVTDAAQTADLAATLEAEGVRPSLVINAAGVLHGTGFAPEKKLEDLDIRALEQVFAVNAFGPALTLKAFGPRMARDGKAVFAAISARVGSIADNRLGGWYAYRASKAALNQIIRTAGIEFSRRNRNVIAAALHPGTTDTALSQPFQANVPAGKLFSVEQTCGYLLSVIDGLTADDSGGFFAWDGKPIEW